MSEQDQLLESIGALTSKLSALTEMIGALVESNALLIETLLPEGDETGESGVQRYMDGSPVRG